MPYKRGIIKRHFTDFTVTEETPAMSGSLLEKHIECTPEVCGGKPRIAGHRIRVQDIVLWHEIQGLSADEIVADFPQITLADVYAALTYYYDHREEIRRAMKEDEDLVRTLRAATPSKVPSHLKDKNAGSGPIPPR
jgi:uncharacterized protein (DUF433 family)